MTEAEAIERLKNEDPDWVKEHDAKVVYCAHMKTWSIQFRVHDPEFAELVRDVKYALITNGADEGNPQ